MNTAAILVGGKGTRLQSLVSDVPKPLANVSGEPFLFLILRALKQAGISRVVLLTGYMHDKIVAACGSGLQFGLDILYSREQTFLGTAGALKHAMPYLTGCSDFLLLNGDTYLDCSLTELMQYPLNQNVIGAIGVSIPDNGKRYGNILLEDYSNQIKSFREKDESLTGLVSAGIYKFSEEIFQYIPDNEFRSLETDIFPHIVNKLHAVRLSGEFCDIGLPESYLAFQEKMKTV